LRGEGLTQREIADALHCKLNNVAYIFRTPQLKAAKPSPAAAIRRRLNRVT
jgi:transcriptional regulator